MLKNASLWFYARYHLSNAFIRSKLWTGQIKILRKCGHKELVRSDQRSEKENTSFNPKKCYRSHLFLSLPCMPRMKTEVNSSWINIQNNRSHTLSVNNRILNEEDRNKQQMRTMDERSERGEVIYADILWHLKIIFPYLEIIVLAIKDSFQGC